MIPQYLAYPLSQQAPLFLYPLPLTQIQSMKINTVHHPTNKIKLNLTLVSDYKCYKKLKNKNKKSDTAPMKHGFIYIYKNWDLSQQSTQKAYFPLFSKQLTEIKHTQYELI